MPRQLKALQELEGSAAARGDMGHLVREAKLLNRSSGIAAADDGDCAAVCNSLRNGDRAVCEVFPTRKRPSDRSNNGACVLHGVCEQLTALRADIETHPAFRMSSESTIFHSGVCTVLGCNNVIDRDEEVDALSLRLVHHFLSELNLVVLADGGTNLVTESLEEGVSHAAADDECVDLFQSGC